VTSRDGGSFSFQPAVQTNKIKTTSIDKSVGNKAKPEKPASDEILKALMAYRKKNGLCYKCGEKWGHNHTCPPQVPLHVIEEVLDALAPT
jgi:hypothetical protein